MFFFLLVVILYISYDQLFQIQRVFKKLEKLK